MAQNLNRIPSGLLSLFQIKSLGTNPDRFEDSVRPVVDLTNNYLTNVDATIARAETTGVNPFTGPGRLAIIEVPAGELWAVRGITTEYEVTTFSASEYFEIDALVDVSEGTQGGIAVTSSRRIGFIASEPQQLNDGYGKVKWFDNPLYLRGGTEVYSTVSYALGATTRISVRTKVFYYGLEV